MAGGVFLIQKDGQLVEMSEESYGSEADFQELIAKYPNILAGNQINDEEPRKWLLISREAALPSKENGSDRWSVDHLFLDQDAIPTIVEVKRSSDTRIRREVVGQMLEYAANAVVYWPVEEIRTKFDATCQANSLNSDEVLEDFLGPSEDPEAFWQKAKTNLQAGKIRMLFVADEIPKELRRIVEFLNEQMVPAEVLAIEIKQFTGNGYKSLVPRVHGRTEEAIAKKSFNAGSKRQWDEKSFFKELESRKSIEEAEIARKIMDWARDKLPRFWWGKGKQDGSFIPVLDHNGEQYYPIAIWTYGKIEIQFQWLMNKSPFNDDMKRKELLKRLNEISGVDIPEKAITRRPNIFLSTFNDASSLRRLLETLDWVVQEIKSS
ncbi:MAG: hypothetical protein M0Q43_07485 [Methanothrix sp.]|nr:hypothetical protein [Methanothrix sp.]